MSYTVHAFTATGDRIRPGSAIEAPTYKAALVAANLIDKRESGFCEIYGPSGAFICTTKPEDRQEGTCDDRA